MSAISRESIAELVARHSLAQVMSGSEEARGDVELLIKSLRSVFARYEGVRFVDGLVLSIVGQMPLVDTELRQNVSAAVMVMDPTEAPHLLVERDGGAALYRSSVPVAGEIMRYEYAGPHKETVTYQGIGYDLEPSVASYSNFAIDYYDDLEDALTMYEDIVLRRFDCDFLERAWENPNSRIFFAHRAERHLRDSLERFLNTRLRGADQVQVFPEQNVDTEHPVDIRVDWSGRRLALIEIKWLGKSRSPKKSRFASQHDNKRARDGLQQLSDYIDAQSFRAIGTEVAGYLVVFDGRRRGLKPPIETLPRGKAEYYRSVALQLQPELLARVEMRQPRRWFVPVHEEVIENEN